MGIANSLSNLFRNSMINDKNYIYDYDKIHEIDNGGK